METGKLKKFAQQARRSLIEQVTAKLKLVLAGESAARREASEAVSRLQEAIETQGKEQVIELVAYIWFNRFCALRFMDVNRYTRIGVVSPSEGQSQPEILAEAKMGHIDDDVVSDATRQQVSALLSGKSTSHDPQGEAYRLLVVAACNYWNQAMPFLFERIDDYTELLMPDDLLSDNSILEQTRQAMTADVCQDVEVIGWLYQFYISEKKDLVFEGLKKNKKVTPENIPAATQLFTPHWIVRYLVENSLGRLWLLNRPHSNLAEQMEYYIKPEEPETDFLKINSPEDIKICDPACGSGHMLTYAFDLLYVIYEEEGYQPSDIPEKILTHNLFGVEIDERAGELAAFALTMKARAKQRRFFSKGIKPNICVLENIHFADTELDDYMDFIGRDLFTEPLQVTLKQFEEADNFGSLIRPELTDVEDILRTLEAKDVSSQLFLSETHQKVLKVLKQAGYLSTKYHVVIANPPYMGSKGMNAGLKVWASENYPSSKSDLFAMFIERGLELVPTFGFSAMVTMQSWMFLSTYQALRLKLLEQTSIEALSHMANMVMGIAFGTSATVWKIGGDSKSVGGYSYVEYEDIVEGDLLTEFPPHNERNRRARNHDWIFRASVSDFDVIPGKPIAYWASQNILETYSNATLLGDECKPRTGLNTGDNDRFVRGWHEVEHHNIEFKSPTSEYAEKTRRKWFPYNKGGDFRKWYGNNSLVVNWSNDGAEIKGYATVRNNGNHWSRFIQNTSYFFKEGLTWSFITSGSFGVRYKEQGYIFDVGGTSAFPAKTDIPYFCALLCSKVSAAFLKILNPTVNFQAGNISAIPLKTASKSEVQKIFSSILSISQNDWDSYETSWDFTTSPLFIADDFSKSLKSTYESVRSNWNRWTQEVRSLEIYNNQIFIDAYGLQDELTPEVPLDEITLTCNPHYRYGSDKSEEKLEELLLADTMRELISYAVGCMFGRYSLDKPGLILANQGETIEDYLKRVPEPSFAADDDNVIPMLDGEWFTDDIVDRFREFLRVAFGDEHYEENLKFVEDALGKDIRKYFLKDFYNDHVKRYKKRPIYWLFSSPKGSFNALIYMHRYRPDTVSVVLNDYLREFRTKLTAQKTHLEAISISASASQSEKTKALKEIEKLSKMITELEDYERDVLYPLATEQVEIDLDDGVKVNYPKFGQALKKVTGLS